MQMKKKLAITLLSIVGAFSTLSMAGCHKSPYSGKISLDYGEIRENDITNITELHEITYNELKSKLTTNESFMLVLYNPTCSCWGTFQPVITQYINETHTRVEYINANEIRGAQDQFGLFTELINMPSVALFQRGKLARQAYYKPNDTSSKMFESYKSFKQWSDENVILPKMLYINRNVLDSYIDDNKEFNLYIARSECGDCQNLNYNILYDYSDKHAEVANPLYIFDIQQYYDTDEYQGIKDEYGLSPKYNPVFGYTIPGFYQGTVPTLQHRVGNQINDMVVPFNDYVKGGEVKSYFTTSRVYNSPALKSSDIVTVLDGHDLTEEQVAKWWDQDNPYSKEFYRTYHYPIVNLFLETYFA